MTAHKKSTMALKPYLESIRNHCKKLSKDELLDLISGIAQDIPPQKRVEFLEKINSLSRGEIEPVFAGDILSRIRNLKEEVDERIESIENGSYYDDYDEWDDCCHDEDPDTISQEQKEELEDFFKQTESVFLSGQLNVAREIYEALFEFFSGDDNSFSSGVSEYDVDVNFCEEKARYCRCVYETSVPDDKVQEMLKAMRVHTSMDEYHFDLSEEKYPMLQDVADAKMGKLPDWKPFLSGWEKTLSKETTDRGNVLLMEAAYLSKGIKGVATLAKKWSARQPRGYLYWLGILISAGDWKGVSLTSREALNSLPNGDFRAQAAGMLIKAGEALNNGNLILKGKRERFYSIPEDRYLINLIKEAEKNGKRNSELEKATNVLKTQKEHNALLVKSLLMAGRLSDAFAKTKDSKPFGWSYGDNVAGVLFGAILAGLTGCNNKAGIISGLLKRYADDDTGSFRMLEKYDVENKEDTSVSSEILKGLKGVVITNRERTKYLSWAEDIGRRRIEHIVDNKYRKAYGRAAETLGALAECLAINGNKQKSRDIIEEYRNQKYNRFPAFKQEIDRVIRSSDWKM